MHHLYLRAETESGGMAEEFPATARRLYKNIRHAISHALDRKLLAEVQGSGKPTLVRVPAHYPRAMPTSTSGRKSLMPGTIRIWPRS